MTKVNASIDASVTAAAAADVSIIVCGLGGELEEEGRDRLRYELPEYQLQYINAVLAANNETIVLLNGGSAIGLEPWISHPNCTAVFMIWYPGEDGGTAIANLISGVTNPSGRLPMTFYKSLDQLPRFDDYDISKNRTYMYLQDDPQFPFGFGLSYTNFTYSNITLNETAASDGEEVLVSLDVTNAGQVAGDEVVQIYVNRTETSAYDHRAALQLRGFERVTIAKGATIHVSIPVKVSDLKVWDPSTRAWVLEPGTYEIMAGASAKNILLATPLSIT
jgi:beta-glucosidase